MGKVWNDFASICIRVRRSPGTIPGQVVIDNGTEPFQFENWLGAETVEPGVSPK